MRGAWLEVVSVYVRREAYVAPDNRPGRVSGPEGASVYVRREAFMAPGLKTRACSGAYVVPDAWNGCMSWENSWQKINGS